MDFNEKLKTEEAEVAAERDKILTSFMRAHQLDPSHWNLLSSGKLGEVPETKPVEAKKK